MTLSVRNPGKIVSFVTESQVRDCDIVVQGTANHTVQFPSGAAPTTPLLGIVYRPGTTAAVTAAEVTAGKVVDIVLDGIYPVRAAAGITRGDPVTSGGADGTAQTAAPAGGTNCGVIGIALTTGVATDRVPVRMACYVMQG